MQKTASEIRPTHHDEQVLVVPRDIFFPHGPWNGFKKEDPQDYLAAIHAHKQFLPRAAMEIDPAYKQIIPYLIFCHKDRYFLMQRHAKASEQRLKSKLTLGIGGHIRQEDMSTGSIIDWAQREFHEEVDYRGALSIEPLGLINDDTTEVGRVHIGLAFLLTGDSDRIAVKSELQHGALTPLSSCLEQASAMESWSQIILKELAAHLSHKS